MADEHLLTKEQIVKAWKDASYRDSLSDEQRAALPEKPPDGIEVSEDQLSEAPGGTGYVILHDFYTLSHRHDELAASTSRMGGRDRSASERFTRELVRLVGFEPDDDVLDRAARIVAAEQSWRDGLGLLLDEEDVMRLLDIDRAQLAAMTRDEELIVLERSVSGRGYPAFQFQDATPTPALAQAHRTMVERGHLSPWSAASWARTSHPELESRSPAQWAGEHRSDEALLLVAERDAARAAQ
jgi:mersacidin/lichenicidin family type 2 lantibiotic